MIVGNAKVPRIKIKIMQPFCLLLAETHALQENVRIRCTGLDGCMYVMVLFGNLMYCMDCSKMF